MDKTESALEAIASGSPAGALRILAGDNQQRRQLAIDVLRVAVEMDDDDRAVIREWLDTIGTDKPRT